MKAKPSRAGVQYIDFSAVDVSGHLNFLFNRTRGYIDVATCDRDQRDEKGKVRPKRRVWKWPDQAEEMTAWIRRMQRREWTEVWVCPYPLRTPERRVGNSSTRRILHADVDKPLLGPLRDMLVSYGARLVGTGTPGHVQVYLRLSRSLTLAEHRAAEERLKDLVHADAKIADNDYLKIPGGMNYKNHPAEPHHKRNAAAYPVEVWNEGRTVRAERVLKWLRVGKVTDQPAVKAPAWQRVPVPMRKMPVWISKLPDETSQGDRSRKCYATVRGMADAGYTPDQIHTWLDEYEPGVDKYGHRWHDQITKILIDQSAEQAGKDIIKYDPTDTFWGRRPVLQHIHRAAVASYAGPWGVLGVVLLRVLHTIRPNVILPHLGGGLQSLNLFVALVAKSGGGKDTAIRAGTEAIDVGQAFRPVNLGSGEGIAKSYRSRGKDGSMVVRANAVLFDAGEISTWNALLGRSGSTLHGELLKGFSGGGLGFQNADDTKSIPVDADTYRMGLVVSAQPAKCGPLFGEHGSGLPQRFLYLPMDNTDQPDDVPDMPPAYVWEGPDVASEDTVVMGACDTARHELHVRNLARVRGQLTEDELDSHWPVIRLRVAVAFALLDGRLAVNDEDWELAGLVLMVSRRCRDEIVTHMRAEKRRASLATGRARGEQRIAEEEVIESHASDKVAARIVVLLKRHGDWMSGADLRRKLPPRYKVSFAGAIASLVKQKVIRRKPVEYRGQRGFHYRA